jgi:Lon protease-like protein
VSATARLPLFPLGTVLFPGVLLPLHVFEERYRQLVRDLLAAPHEDRRFGVVAIREGREVGVAGVRALHRVGCVARVRRVEPYDDGRFDIVTSGSQRFRLGRLAEGKAYLQADVELLGEPLGADAGSAAAQVGQAWTSYRDTLGAAAELDDRADGDATSLSYLVAAGMVLDLTERQRLLEAPDTAERLQRELALLRRETGLLGRLPSLPAVELTHLPVSPN